MEAQVIITYPIWPLPLIGLVGVMNRRMLMLPLMKYTNCSPFRHTLYWGIFRNQRGLLANNTLMPLISGKLLSISNGINGQRLSPGFLGRLWIGTSIEIR
jgi:hypothetical protein